MEVSKGHRAGKSSSAIGVDAGRRRSVCVPLSGCFFHTASGVAGFNAFRVFFSVKSIALSEDITPLKAGCVRGFRPFEKIIYKSFIYCFGWYCMINRTKNGNDSRVRDVWICKGVPAGIEDGGMRYS